MTWSERWACMPSLPPDVTEKLARVRHPRPVPASYVVRPVPAPLPATASTTVRHVSPPGQLRSTPASRFSCSASTAALRLRWRPRATWPNSAPPTGGCPCAQARRESAGVPEVLHPVRARPPGLPPRRRARIWLPRRRRSGGPGLFRRGCAWRTKITRPSWRATQWPPWATGPTSSTSSAGRPWRSGLGLGLGVHWISCMFLASSDDFSCHGTLATITPGSKCSRVLMRSAVWLWTSCSHHLPTTYSGM